VVSQVKDRLDLLIPLYGFTADGFRVSDVCEVVRYDAQLIGGLFRGESRFSRTLALNPPDTLLWKHRDLSRLTSSTEFLKAADNGLRELGMFLLRSYAQEIGDFEGLITSLRLYKSGQFRRGRLWALMEFASSDNLMQGELDLRKFNKRFGSGGFGHDAGPQPGYSFDTHNDESAFRIFEQEWKAVMLPALRFPRVNVALGYYNESYSDKPEAAQLVDLITGLEALLVSTAESLSYHIAVRCANLLGTDADQRRSIFAETKAFYDARSRLVHGDELKSKHSQRLSQLSTLREVTRRVLLAAVSLASSVEDEQEYFKVLEEMALDDELRVQTQQRASRLLHL
jgi:hypothetical protein